MKRLLLLGVALFAVGCGPVEVVHKVSSGEDTEPAQKSAPKGGIAPMTAAPVGIAPVSGYEGVQGGSGGGTGQAAKDMARRVAAPQPPPVTTEAGE